MAVRDGFWNSMVGDIRTYYNTDFSHILGLLIKDGVYQNYGQALITIPGEGLQVIVQQGEAWFDEHWIRNDSDLQVAIDTAPIVSGYSRIDAIAIKVDSTPSLEGRHVTIEYIPGTAGTEPVAPELIDTDIIKYHLLCTVTVAANATSITQANITNYIGTDTTPFISGILETIDSSVLLAQWSAQFTEFMQGNESEFNTWKAGQQNDFTIWMTTEKSAFETWFETIRGILDEDAAGHLQSEIDALDTRVDDVESISTLTTGTLTTGSTTITLQDERIQSNSYLDFYTSIYGVAPNEVTVSEGSVTLTFDEQESNMTVGVKVGGIQ